MRKRQKIIVRAAKRPEPDLKRFCEAVLTLVQPPKPKPQAGKPERPEVSS